MSNTIRRVPYDEWPDEEKARWMKLTIWRTQDNRVYEIHRMTKTHLENAIMHLFKNGYDIPDAFYEALRRREQEEKDAFSALPEHIKWAQVPEDA